MSALNARSLTARLRTDEHATVEMSGLPVSLSGVQQRVPSKAEFGGAFIKCLRPHWLLTTI